jgi:hypothetical protein
MVAPERDIILIRDEAFTPEEYAAWRRECDRVNARRRVRRASDPEYAERCRAYQREYRRTHGERLRDYHREWMRNRRRAASIGTSVRPIMGSLHSLSCSNDPCICTPTFVLESPATIGQKMDNNGAEVAAESHTLESRPTRPVRYLASGGSLRDTGGRR